MLVAIGVVALVLAILVVWLARTPTRLEAWAREHAEREPETARAGVIRLRYCHDCGAELMDHEAIRWIDGETRCKARVACLGRQAEREGAAGPKGGAA